MKPSDVKPGQFYADLDPRMEGRVLLIVAARGESRVIARVVRGSRQAVQDTVGKETMIARHRLANHARSNGYVLVDPSNPLYARLAADNARLLDQLKEAS